MHKLKFSIFSLLEQRKEQKMTRKSFLIKSHEYTTSERVESMREMIEMRKFLNEKFLLWFFIAHLQLTQVTTLNYLKAFELWHEEFLVIFNENFKSEQVPLKCSNFPAQKKSAWHLTFSRLLFSAYTSLLFGYHHQMRLPNPLAYFYLGSLSTIERMEIKWWF